MSAPLIPITKSRLLKLRVVMGSCWVWVGSRFKYTGYGKLKHKGKTLKVHRLAYLLWIGPIPKGKNVCHSCDNPPCFNPKHLFSGTHQDNRDDAVRKQRHAWGQRSAWAKLTNEEARKVRLDKRPSSVVGREYGLHRATVWKLRSGKSYRLVA